MIKIGNVELENKVFLSPMAGDKKTLFSNSTFPIFIIFVLL